MDISVKSISDASSHRSPCLVVTILSDGKLSKAARQIDKASKGSLRKLIKRGDISGDTAQLLLLPELTHVSAERVLLVGVGNGKKITQANYLKIQSSIIKQLSTLKIKEASLFLEELTVEKRDHNWVIQQLAIAGGLNTYRYTQTLSKPKPASSLKRLTVAENVNKTIRNAAAQGTAIAKGMNVARELGNLPGNICTPTYLATQARALGRKHKSLKVSVLEEKKMRELGMGSLLSVTAGTDQPAKLIVMEYQGTAKSKKPHALVGKGITFDSGGISLKPGAKMVEMKFDMCGAASVFGTMTAITELKLPINVVAVVAAVENMPSASATKPGDVVTSMSGQTIEVLNTDAEGRLVLCDALTYVEKYKPQSVVDIATLTGACVVALGHHATAIYSNEDDLAQALANAGDEVNDRGWHMPMWDDYQGQLNSNFADIGNIGGPAGGSITAACFLSRFTQNMRWAHLDIAGTAWHSGGNKGATGRPVGMLTQYLMNQIK